MKASTERKIIRWLHIITSIPVVGYIYGPLKNVPQGVFALKWVLFPLVVLSGLWMWKGHFARKWLRKKSQITSQ
jgi:thiosulfate reductase cytochrome b subunit